MQCSLQCFDNVVSVLPLMLMNEDYQKVAKQVTVSHWENIKATHFGPSARGAAGTCIVRIERADSSASMNHTATAKSRTYVTVELRSWRRCGRR